jgi:Pectate lyase superfamily protein
MIERSGKSVLLAFLLVLVAAITFSTGAKATEFNVRSFGALGDGRADDQPAIQRAIDAAIHSGKGADIVIPAGTYRLEAGSAGSNAHLNIKGAMSLTIRGEGQVLLISGTPQLNIFGLEQSADIHIAHLVMDRGPLLFTQGVVTGIDPLRKTAVVDVEPGYDPLDAPFVAGDTMLLVFSDPGSGTWGDHSAACAYYRPEDPTVCWPPFITGRKHLQNSSWEVSLNIAPEDNYVGKKFVIWSRQYKGNAFLLRYSENVSIEDVHYYGGGDDGFVVVHCSGQIVFRNFSIGVPPASDRLFAAAGGAMIFNNHAQIVLDDVSITRVWDDDINIGANYARIFSQTGPHVLNVDGTRADMQIGDHVAILDWVTKIEKGRARITSLECAVHGYRVCTIGLDGAIAVEHTGFAEIKSHGNDNDGIDRIIDLDSAGKFTSERSHFQSLRGRCLVIKSSDSLVKDNSCADTVLGGIVIGPSFFWDEGPQVHDIAIVNNIFTNVSGPNILVSNGGDANAAGARGISIVSNAFVDFGRFAQGVMLRSTSPILLQDAEQVTVRENRSDSKYAKTLPSQVTEVSGRVVIR